MALLKFVCRQFLLNFMGLLLTENHKFPSRHLQISTLKTQKWPLGLTNSTFQNLLFALLAFIYKMEPFFFFFFASLALYHGDFALFQNVSRSYTFNRDVTAGNLYISLVCIMISYERLRQILLLLLLVFGCCFIYGLFCSSGAFSHS